MTAEGGERASDLPYRPCVGVMLVDDRGRVFVGRRVDTPDAWQMPQGGIDPGESAVTAAFRELAEEIGTARAELLAESGECHRYDLPPRLQGRIWGGRFRGQEQRWVLLRFTGDDAEIDVSTGHPEFDDWRWVEPDALVDLIVPFKRDVYRAVLREFRPRIDEIRERRRER